MIPCSECKKPILECICFKTCGICASCWCEDSDENCTLKKYKKLEIASNKLLAVVKDEDCTCYICKAMAEFKTVLEGKV